MGSGTKEKKYQVFVSSTYEDLKEERAAVSQTLLDLGCIPVGMEQFPASGMSQMDYIKKMLETCDYYILILAGRYGSVDLADGIGYTEKEYDYAVANGCSRFCIPATAVNYSMIRKNGQYLSYTYDINDQSRIDPLPIKSITGENVTVNFVLVTLYGMEKGNTIDRYRDGLAAAQAIVDAIPEGLDDQGKMLYLYRYLTENVRYYEGDYYGGSDWCLLYDALVQHSTVCTGYTEALYVLCNLAGIECFNVSGEVGELLSGGMHAWNVARINGQYYEFDATWDEGLPPADYRFFGMSTAYSLENHTRLMRSFDLSFCPDCPENLLPEALLPASENDPAYPIFWYYLLRNAMDASPEKMFEYLGYEEDQIRAVEPKNG